MKKVQNIYEIVMLLNTKANNRYGLSDVTQKQHALQCALLAEEANETPEMIAAALLHDIGHMLHDLGEDFADKKIDDDHENIGMAYLKDRVSSKVYQPIALHVQAKRYLCAAEPEYFQKLSEDSVKSLELQGGKMNPKEMEKFQKKLYWKEALRLRKYDDRSKNPKLTTPEPEHFVQYLNQCFR